MRAYKTLRLLPVLLIAATLTLSACDNAQQRAEKHYQAGIALLDKGDVDRALVEFRNVFQLDGHHLNARLAYARIQRDRGQFAEAYSQYLLVVEQYPDNLEGRLALAEMAIDRNDWQEAQRHGAEAIKIAPDDPMAQVIGALLTYQTAAVNKDRAAEAAPAAQVQALLDAHADNKPLALLAYRVLIDQAYTGSDPTLAMSVLDKAIALNPQNLEWQMLKLKLLINAGDQPAIGSDLNALYTLFPQEQRVRDLLIGWYMQQKDLDGAEAFLRRVADDTAKSTAPTAAKDAVKAKLNVVQFLKQARSDDAAMAELDKLIAADPTNVVYQATKAAMVFSAGQKDEAIAALTTLLKTAPDSDDTRNVKVALARMLVATGNNTGAQALIEEVLAADPTHVAALKMKAAWLIQADKPGDAIIALRTALDQDPKDADILTLMGQAHERDGARDLAGERYAAAVDVSGKAAPESLRYANFLIVDNRLDSALSVLEDSLQVNPRDPNLLGARASLLIRQQDWDNAKIAVDRLRALGTPAAIQAANQLDAATLLKQDKVDDTIAFLGSLSNGADANISAVAAVVQAQIKAGNTAAAKDYLDGLLAKTPEDPVLRYLRAGVYVMSDQPDEAEKIYRALMSEQPDNLRPFQALYKLLLAGNRADEASALLDGALVTTPTSPALNLMKATALEKAGDFDGAIAIYDALYARDSSNLVVANNLASLLTSHHDDAPSIDRAFTIAHRLRGSNVPAFQDTYGWIAYRRGDFAEALTALEPAAKGLAQDPMVQVHLGLTYAALKQADQARATLAAALALAGDAASQPQFAEAQKTLTDLGGPPPSP
jgi:cellulose synthase operon protein C